MAVIRSNIEWSIFQIVAIKPRGDLVWVARMAAVSPAALYPRHRGLFARYVGALVIDITTRFFDITPGMRCLLRKLADIRQPTRRILWPVALTRRLRGQRAPVVVRKSRYIG